MWLQSLEDPGLALPVTNPHRFFADFAVEVVDEDAERLGIDELECDGRVCDRAGGAGARGLHGQPEGADPGARPAQAWQVINQAPGCELRVPLFPHGEANGAHGHRRGMTAC